MALRRRVVALALAGGAVASGGLGCWLAASFSGLGDHSGAGDSGAAERQGGGPDGGGSGSGSGSGTGTGSGTSAVGTGTGSGGSTVDSGGDGNLAVNGGFEDTGGVLTACQGWTTYSGGGASISTIAHSGKYSCKLCPPPGPLVGGDEFALYNTSGSGGSPNGTTYEATAWVRLAPDGDAGAGAPVDAGTSPPVAQVQLKAQVGSTMLPFAGGEQANFGTTWLQFNTTSGFGVTIDAGAAETVTPIVFFFYRDDAGMGTGGCVLIDDVTLFTIPP